MYWLVTVSITTELPLSSHSAIGVALMPPRVASVIWISGKARPIRSPSSNGNPTWLATANGIVELSPPASAHITAATFLPRYFSIAVNAPMNCRVLGNFSIATVGAPTSATGTTRSSSPSESTSIMRTGPCRRIMFIAMSLPMYGSPPPPVP